MATVCKKKYYTLNIRYAMYNPANYKDYKIYEEIRSFSFLKRKRDY